MVKYHINNWMSNQVKEMTVFQDLTEEEHDRLYNEIKNATLQGLDDKLKELYESSSKVDNKVNSLLLWVLGLASDKPTGPQKIKSLGSMMDIDLDFSKKNRDKVYSYLKEKYGEDKVSNVATFGTMAAKGAIRNAARALGYSQELQNKVAKFIPELPNITIQSSIDSNKDFQELIDTDSEVKHIINIALKLEGLPNSIGGHASACIISDIPISDAIPLMTSTRKENAQIMTQFEYKDVENCNFIKFDVLGLETLDIIDETRKLVKIYKNIDIDIDNIDINDKGIYELLNNGNVANIFQFDGSVQAFLPKIKPSNIDEVSAITAICRPGPLSLGLHERYAEAKFESKKFDYGIKDEKLLKEVWKICDVSYGLMVFQEEMINCFKYIAGFDDTLSEKARKATGKKDAVLLASLENEFVEGGLRNGFSEEGLRQLFEQFKGFSEYSFNAGHSYAYSIITCQTAYLSYYYPLEFFVASLTICSNNTEKVRHFIKAIKERGFTIKPPNINKSDDTFIIADGSIIFGFGAIKGVGAAVSKKVIRNRPKSGYKSLGHFIQRNKDLVNSKVLESYAKAGVFSDFGNKESILQSIRDMLDYNSIIKDINTYTIFDLCKINYSEFIDNCILKKINVEDKLSYEIDSLGLYLKKHPMEEYILDRDNCIDIKDLKDYDDGTKVITVGALSCIEVKKTKAKLNMSAFNLDSYDSTIKCMMFTKAHAKYGCLLEEGILVGISGYLKVEDSGISIAVNDMTTDLKGLAYKVFKKKEDITEEFILNDRVKFILRGK